jgi:hypothetical protein
MAEITLVAAFSTVPGGEADAIYTDTRLTLGGGRDARGSDPWAVLHRLR